jgi:integrase
MKQQRDKYQSGGLWEERGKWWLRYSETHADGKTERPTVCVGTVEQYNTKKKARIAADRIMEEVNDKVIVTRFDALCDDYEKRGIGHVRKYTALTYQSTIRTLRAAFGTERVDTLASVNGRMRMETWLNGTKMAATSRHRNKAILSLIFRHAMRWNFLNAEKNPIDLIDLRNMPHCTTPKRKRTVLTPEQYQALQAAPELCLLDKTIIAIMQMAGLRGCEALGLSWEHGKPDDTDYRPNDIDLNGNPAKIWVRRSVKGPHIDEPKTAESQRAEPLPATLAAILLRWKTAQPTINNWVFGSTRTGRPWNSGEIRRRIKAAAKKRGFDYEGFGLHNHRHTFRRNFATAGATPEQQMWAMGHSTLPTTMGYGGDGFDRTTVLAPYAERVVSILEGKKPV